MKYSFLFHLLSFLPIHTPPPVVQHILISEVKLPDKTEIELLTKKKKIDTWIHFQSHKHGWDKNEVNVYLPDFFYENENKPDHLKSSLYHYNLYSSHRFRIIYRIKTIVYWKSNCLMLFRHMFKTINKVMVLLWTKLY
jgi:hypothetical protein